MYASRGKIVSNSPEKPASNAKLTIEYRAQFLTSFNKANARLRSRIRRISRSKNSYRLAYSAVSAAEELIAFKERLNEEVEGGSFDLPAVYERDESEPIGDRVHLTVGRWQAIFDISREKGIVYADTFAELTYSEVLRQGRRHRFGFVKRIMRSRKR